MIQRWTIDAREYVTYADHVAREAELMRLLKAYRHGAGHKRCSFHNMDDHRCLDCKAVDALEVSK